MSKKVFFVSIMLVFVFIFVSKYVPRAGGTLRVGIPGGVISLAPWDFPYGVRGKVLVNIYETLLTQDWVGPRVKPGLAEDWEADEENRIFTLTLREGVGFHNAKPLTADDVVASADYFFEGFQFKVEKIGRMKVSFTVDRPTSNFPFYLSRPASSVAAPLSSVREYKALREKGETFRFRPVGTGPFRLVSWKRGRELVLAVNGDYWGKSPYLSRLVYRVIPDHEERIAALNRGEIDLTDLVYPRDLVRLRKNRDIVIKSTPGLTICYLGMNNKRGPFSNRQLRRVIGFSIDKDVLAKKFFYGGYGIPTDRPFPASFFGLPPLSHIDRYNPTKARELLAQAGYPEGLSIRLVTLPFSRPYIPDPKGCAEEIKKELALVGIDVNIVVPEDFKGYIDLVEFSDDFDLVLAGWSSTVIDPDFMLTPILGSPSIQGGDEINISRFDNEAFDEKLFAARRLPLSDVWGRMRIYNEAISIFSKELPFIPLFHTNMFLVCNKRVKGARPTPGGNIYFTRVWLKD
jgi:peptide/nickel transport system substrate-binding protein